MSYEDIALLSLVETTKSNVQTEEGEESSSTRHRKKQKDKTIKNKSLFWRFPSFRSTWRPKFGKIRNPLQKISCIKGVDEEEMMKMDVPRHKSIDISVGFARRVSLFIFTRRSVCVHPYHPYTPAQTTRKIHINTDDKQFKER